MGHSPHRTRRSVCATKGSANEVTLALLCCIEDEGRPLRAAFQEEASNHRKLRRSRAGVVSVTEKAEHDSVRCVSRR